MMRCDMLGDLEDTGWSVIKAFCESRLDEEGERIIASHNQTLDRNARVVTLRKVIEFIEENAP